MPQNRKVGIFKDPWRNAGVPSALPKASVPSEPPQVEESDNAFSVAKQSVQFVVPNYGGLTVTGTDQSPEAAKRILEFCINHLQKVEPILLQYGIVVLKLGTDEINAKFYIRRSDGWILAIPQVTTKEQGLLQLVQSFLAMEVVPQLREFLRQYQIKAYKL